MNKIIAIPYKTRYDALYKYLLKNITNCDIITPLNNNLTIGNKYSPKDTSLKLKYSIGNSIEILERKANILIQDNDKFCSYEYNELQKIILTNLGYDFKFMNIYK